MGTLEVGLGFLVVRELDIENPTSEIKLGGVRTHAHSIAHDIDANLKRLVRQAKAGKIQIEIHVSRIPQNRLPQRLDRLWRLAGIFVGGGCQFQSLRIRAVALQQRRQRNNGLLWFLGHHLYRGEKLTLAPIVRI